MATEAQEDYYAVLQVSAEADPAVIEAAYRQLMKKHHPDKAGTDPRRIAEFHERAKAINQAFSVLRDPRRRREYDLRRQVLGWRHTSRLRSDEPWPVAEDAWSTPPQPAYPVAENPAVTLGPSTLSPLSMLMQAYYLLPGAYEWERGGSQELLTTLMLPVIGVGGFCLATGRLEPIIGHSFSATILAWGVLIVLSIPLWQALPRIALASVPSVTVLSGALNPVFAHTHVPIWLPATLLNVLSLALAARMYLFGVLPAIAACWLIAHFT